MNTDSNSSDPSNSAQQNSDNGKIIKSDDGVDNPDLDTIKMFVGQIPKSWDEAKLKEFFEQYGPVFHLNVLRDKETDSSRGCCFVTFFHRKDAINAQNALHNILVMPGLNHPVQMKPADVENRNDRKLFIGMLSKTISEEDVRELFKEFGQIEDCSILRENGRSKGCAFLTFVNRSCAHQAIRKMNQSQIFEGCTKPVVVKFADAVRDKGAGGAAKKSAEEKRSVETNSQKANTQMASSQLQQPVVGQSGVEVLTNLVSLLQQPGIATLLESARVIQQLQHTSQPQSLVTPPTTIISTGSTASSNLPSIVDYELKPIQFAPFQQQQAAPMSPRHHHQQQQTSTYPQPSLSVQTTMANLLNLPTAAGLLFQPNIITAGITPYPFTTPSPYAQLGFGHPNLMLQNISPNSQPYGSNMSMISPHPLPLQSAAGSEKNSRGPEGCNLFIYHLPQEFTDADLYATFCSFGNILSAKVFVDKQTNLSKCFGFVSYSDESSAHNAINGMNGHQIGNKRLKVQLKRSEKPYDKPTGNLGL